MRLIKKAALEFVDGMLIESKTGEVLFSSDLQDEVNELVDLAELITFVKANTAKIEATADGKGKKLVFKSAVDEAPRITAGVAKPATPLKDAAVEEAKALAEEFLEVQKFEDVQSNLDRYSTSADFLSKDYLVLDIGDGGDYAHAPFKMNPLELTESFIIDTVTAYHDPAIRKLINGVVIGR